MTSKSFLSIFFFVVVGTTIIQPAGAQRIGVISHSGSMRFEHVVSNKKYKSPELALGLSAFNTIVPILTSSILLKNNTNLDRTRFWLLAYGVLLGPSTGYFYIGEHGTAFGGFALRAVGTGVSFLGIALAVENLFRSESEKSRILPITLYFGGLALIAYSMTTSLAKVWKATESRNATHHTSKRFHLYPTFSGPRNGAGLALLVEL